MSYANGTTHYNLPQTVGTDKRDWADPNQAFADIDAAIYGAVQDTAQAALDIDALEGRMDTAEQGISTNAGNIAGLDTRLTTAEGAITSMSGQITDTRQDLEDMICAYNESSATSTHAYVVGDYFIYNDVLYRATQSIAIGDTIVPDTNCTTTNVTTEIQSIEDLSGDVAQLQSDIGTIQQDISKKGYKLLGNVDNVTSYSDLRSLFGSIGIDSTKHHMLVIFNESETIFLNEDCHDGTVYSLSYSMAWFGSSSELYYTRRNLRINSTSASVIDFSITGTTVSTFTPSITFNSVSASLFESLI